MTTHCQVYDYNINQRVHSDIKKLNRRGEDPSRSTKKGIYKVIIWQSSFGSHHFNPTRKQWDGGADIDIVSKSLSAKCLLAAKNKK